MRQCAAALVLILACAVPAWAVSDPGEMLASPVLEHRAEVIGEQLRCLVCQNESVEQSDADLARDLRRIIRQQVVAGKSDEQIIDWMTARYGDFIRLRPPLDMQTLALWGAPAIALAVGAGAILLARRRRPEAPPPLSAAERKQLMHLLD